MINIAEKLKDAPKGKSLYSAQVGDVVLQVVGKELICVTDTNGATCVYDHYGKACRNGECLLFPSRNNRDWNTFDIVSSHQYKPFDKILVRESSIHGWFATLCSHTKDGGVLAVNGRVYPEGFVLPYEGNEDKLGKVTHSR